MNKGYTVLNVEDLQNNRDLVRRILESQGYRVIDAENGLEGINKAVEIKPDLILMDINLPDIDGFSVVTKIRSYPHLSSIPIIALTARNISDDAERAAAIGCDGYLSKPFGVTALIQEVSSRIGKPRAAKEESKREFYLREQSISLVDELERKLQELQATHERLQRLDQAKTDFIQVASHELRTPLTMVHVYTDMLRTHPKLVGDENIDDMMNGLRKGVDRLRSIINDMISIVRVELASIDLAYAPISLKTVFNPLHKEYGPAIRERGLVLTVDIPDNPPLIVGDDTQLSQVFSRLVGNAVKYTPDGGKIKIAATVYSTEKGENGGGQFIEVTVSDTGIGINKEDQTRIFEKFTTVENVSLHSSSKTQFMGGGPGLGLTIAKGIVEAHGGRIWVESEGYDPKRNPGSIFYVLLPAHKD